MIIDHLAKNIRFFLLMSISIAIGKLKINKISKMSSLNLFNTLIMLKMANQSVHLLLMSELLFCNAAEAKLQRSRWSCTLKMNLAKMQLKI